MHKKQSKFVESARTLAGKPRQALLKRHPLIVPVITFLALFFALLAGFIAMGGKTVGPDDVYVVNVYSDEINRVVPTRAKTVGDLLARLGIALGPEDKVEPSATTLITENGFNINIYRARYVSIRDKDADKTVELFSAEPTPRLLAKAAGIKINPEDIVEKEQLAFVTPENALSQGFVEESIVIDRAVAVKLNLYGKLFEVKTHAETVGQLLGERDINPGNVSVFPEVELAIEKTDVVFVTDPNKDIKLSEESLPPATEYVNDFNLLLGRTDVREEGKDGKKVVIYEVDKKGGRTILQEVIVERPITRVVARGKKAPVIAGNKAEILSAAGISQSEFYAVDFIISHESGWRVNALSYNGCAGLGQACPASKLAAVCPSWETDAVCQMRFFNNYAVNRYGSWTRAFEIWQLQRWW